MKVIVNYKLKFILNPNRLITGFSVVTLLCLLNADESFQRFETNFRGSGKIKINIYRLLHTIPPVIYLLTIETAEREKREERDRETERARERKREGERDRERKRERQRDRER